MKTKTNSMKWSWMQLNERRATRTAMLLLLLLLIMPFSGAQAAVVFSTLYSFTGGNDGGAPQAALVQGKDGKFYGTTELGGDFRDVDHPGFGTVFRFDPATNKNVDIASSFSHQFF